MTTPHVSLRMCMDAASTHFGITRADLVSYRLDAQTNGPRQVTMWLAKELTPLSLQEIGRRMGGRHRSAILHGIRRVEERRSRDANFRDETDIITGCIVAAAKPGRLSSLDEPDVMVVAMRLATLGSRARVSNDELAALANFAVLQGLKLGWLQIEGALPDEVEDDEPAPVMTDAVLVGVAQAVVASHEKFESVRFSAGERHARETFEAALKALKTTLEQRS